MKDKEEYYATPLYLYNVLRKDTDKENEEEKNPNLELHNVYTSTKLRSICFTILD